MSTFEEFKKKEAQRRRIIPEARRLISFKKVVDEEFYEARLLKKLLLEIAIYLGEDVSTKIQFTVFDENGPVLKTDSWQEASEKYYSIEG